jgi:AhpD family alkylhydroperoxidase
MARIPGIPRADAPEDVRRVYDWAEKTFGKPLEPLMVVAHHPALFRTYVAFEMGLETADLLPARLKELVQLKAAARIGCPFCLDIGSALARRAGLDEATLRALVDHGASDAFSPAEKLALDYTVAMTATPVVVPDGLVAALTEHFDAAEIVELSTLVAWENFRSRFNHALGIGAAGFSAGAYCVRPEIPAS